LGALLRTSSGTQKYLWLLPLGTWGGSRLARALALFDSPEVRFRHNKTSFADANDVGTRMVMRGHDGALPRTAPSRTSSAQPNLLFDERQS